MPTDLQAELDECIQHLFAFHYHSESTVRELPSTDELPGGFEVPRLDDAARRIRELLASDSIAPAVTARLALGQVSRVNPEGQMHDHHRRAAHEVIGGLLDNDGFHEATADSIGSDPGKLLEALHQGAEPSDRFFNSFAHDLHQIEGRSYRLRGHVCDKTYQNRITDAYSCVEVQRPSSDLVRIVDPRNWTQNLGAIWRNSGFVEPTKSREGNGVPRPEASQGTFFEEAAWVSTILSFADYRNLLDLCIDLTSDSIEFEYTESECLTTSFVGAEELGGIDVDHGHGKCVPASGSGEEPWCRLEARKAARFSRPHGLGNLMYNDIASVYLPMLIDMFVMFGSQLPSDWGT